MKHLLFISLLGVIGCQVTGEKTRETIPSGDTLSLYLTYDIAINSCLLSWEDLEKKTLAAAISGSLEVYQTAFSGLIPIEEREKTFSFTALDVSTGQEAFITMSHISFERVDHGFMLYENSPFTGDDIICGYVKSEDLLKINTAKSNSLLTLLENYHRFPKTGKSLSPSTMYTSVMLLLDSLQKQIAFQVENENKYPLLNEKLETLSEEKMRGLVQQTEDSLGADNKVYTITVRVPENDLWKGFMAYGILSPEKLSWSAFGLLYHPNTKYGGFNPGKILWFAIPSQKIQEADSEIYGFLSMLAQNAMLYSADPVQYKSEYFRNNSIGIDNGRYPGSRR